MISAIIFFVVLPGLIETSKKFCADFKKVNILPSSSCHTVSNPSPNIGNCFQACVKIGRSVYMVGQHAITNECVCCQLPLLSDTEHNEGEWRSFVRCPERYTVVEVGTRVTCLRFVSTKTGYYNASLHCQSEDGDLVRIESPRYIPILQNLFYTKQTKTSRFPWVQGTRDNSSIWRYHDGTNMSDVMTNYISDFDYGFGDYLILSLHYGDLFGDIPDVLLPFICEYELT